MLRSILAILGGYLVMVVIVTLDTFAVQLAAPAWFTPNAPPSASYLALNIGYSCLAALVGGYVAARYAPRAPFRHAVILGGLTLIMGIVSAVFAGAGQPRWYQVLLVLLMPAVVVSGGALSSRQPQ